MFLNIHIDLITLKTHDQQFTLTTKKSLHIIFNNRQKDFEYIRKTGSGRGTKCVGRKLLEKSLYKQPRMVEIPSRTKSSSVSDNE